MKFTHCISRCLTLLVVVLVPLVGFGQAYPMNNSQNNMNMNSQINYDLSASYSVLMDPIYGYGANESTTNFSARNYWEQYTAANPNDPNAWFNYYRSTRYIAEGSAGFRELQSDLDSISNHLKRYSGGTWEQLIVEYWNSNRDPKKEAILNAAYRLRPNDPLTLRFMTGMEYLHGQSRSVYDYYVKWKSTGELPVSTETYAYNVMQSVPADAILFTNGEMDTYPLLYQMQTINQNSVKIVSVAMCNRADNRSRIFSNAGLVIPDNDLTSAINADYIARVAAANPTKKIYIASTCGAAILKPLSSDLYCTGLAFRYSTTAIDHLTYLRDNVGTRFKLDNVGKPRASTNRFDVNYSASLEMNYYLPLLIAADQYVQAGNPNRAAQLRAKAITLRQRAGYDEPIRSEE